MSRYQPYPKYKASGVEWLGEVPEHWKNKSIKYVASCNDDVLGENTSPDFELEYVEISDVSYQKGIEKFSKIKFSEAPSRARRKVIDGDVIVSTVRTYLRAISPVIKPSENTIVSTGFAVVRPHGVVPKYLGYVFLSEYLISKIIAHSTGVSYPAINSSELVSQKITIPTTSEQTAIANFLDIQTAKIDTLLAKQQRMIELLSEKRQALISHAVTKGLNPNVPMKDSGVAWLGDVPAHWTVKKAKFLFEFITSGSRGWAEYYSDDGALFFRITNLTRNTIEPKLESLQYVMVPSDTEGERAKIKKNDLLISITADLGSVCVATESIAGGYVSQHVSLCRPNNVVVSPRWLGYYILSDIAKEQFYSSGYGGTKIQLSLEDIREIVVVQPDEQTAIADYLDTQTAKIDTLISKTKQAIALLQERRNSLISAAVTGKIDVRNSA